MRSARVLIATVSATSAEIFAAKLCRGFAALLKKEIFENEPPLLRVQGLSQLSARYLAIECEGAA